MGKQECRAVRAVVRGRVQGVGFRYFIVSAAQPLGLRGWVRNRPDGAVEIVAEGAPEAIEALLVEAGRGPAWARVDRLEREEIEPSGGTMDGFEVRF